MARFRRPRLEIPIRRVVSDAVAEPGVRQRRSDEREASLERGRFRRWAVRAAIAGVFLVGCGAATLGERGLWDLMRSRAEKRTLAAEVEAAKERVDRLAARVDRLKNAPEAYERLAREELGYALDGETVFVFPHTSEAPWDRSAGAPEEPPNVPAR